MDLNFNSNSTIFFDTAPFIYYFEDHPDYGKIVDQLLVSIYENNSSFVTSYITYLELITKPKSLEGKIWLQNTGSSLPIQTV